MEAISAGAAKVKGAVIEGVICPTMFPSDGCNGNKYLTFTTRTDSIFRRLQLLHDKADAIIVLPGSMGTLTELMVSWTSRCTGNTDTGRVAPLLVDRLGWQSLIQTITASLNIKQKHVDKIFYFDSLDQIIAVLKKLE